MKADCTNSIRRMKIFASTIFCFRLCKNLLIGCILEEQKFFRISLKDQYES